MVPLSDVLGQWNPLTGRLNIGSCYDANYQKMVNKTAITPLGRPLNSPKTIGEMSGGFKALMQKYCECGN